ncbi:hypothetical protein [Sphingomonas sp. DBB INV C78]|uniref:hypothetical protein n=1 Tax=Sphingomonas sp. DBB INV C78 TaxID=3349434 RepID=UPI0036D3ECB3
MMLLIVGLSLAGVTLSDVIRTVLVPGDSQATLRTPRRLAFLLLPLWRHMNRRGLSGMFAPIVLIASFTVWMSLLAAGFGMAAYALRAAFQPALTSFADAFYLVGSSLVTVGISETEVTGGARWIILGSGFCGLAVMTMAVTYFLQVQSSTARRDVDVFKLGTSAGDPPSALILLERFASIHNQSELGAVLREGRTWCATVRQSHATHPSLIYFDSAGTGSAWPAALGALLDLALIIQFYIDDDRLYGPAVLLRDEGTRMAKILVRLAGLEAGAPATDKAALEQVASRLAAAGYRLRDEIDYQQAASARTEHQIHVAALAEHLGKPTAPLVPPVN